MLLFLLTMKPNALKRKVLLVMHLHYHDFLGIHENLKRFFRLHYFVLEKR